MASTYRLVSVVLADDARKEDSGKDILIGIYSGSIVAAKIPVVLPTFALWFEIRPNKTKYTNVAAKIQKPDGNDLARIQAELGFTTTAYNASFFFKLSPLIIETTGEHKIFLGMDEELEYISSFIVAKREQIAS